MGRCVYVCTRIHGRYVRLFMSCVLHVNRFNLTLHGNLQAGHYACVRTHMYVGEYVCVCVFVCFLSFPSMSSHVCQRPLFRRTLCSSVCVCLCVCVRVNSVCVLITLELRPVFFRLIHRPLSCLCACLCACLHVCVCVRMLNYAS